MSYLQIYFIIGLITAVINVIACAAIYKELKGLHILVSLFITMPFWPVIWLKGFCCQCSYKDTENLANHN